MNRTIVTKKRCAVYTRKSSEEGLEQEFNSLDAQRESCQAYVLSQKAQGWVLHPDHYDDGGFSGGTLDRPALKRLLADIEAGKVDIVVVYKIDRLSRSIMDFAKMVEVFDRNEVTFVSVTQAFNTTDSMGRLTLNMLLSFAQFEREVIGERIRDKFEASRRKGLWMGGWTPLGYDVKERKLLVNQAEAALVQDIFKRFARFRSGTRLVQQLADEGKLNKQGKPIDKSYLYKLLNNRVYIGDAVHKGQSFPGEHQAIISQELWDDVHAVLKESPRARAGRSRAQTPALLRGLIFGPSGEAMTPSHTRKKGRLYRYYVSTKVIKNGASGDPASRLPAAEIEAAVIDQLRRAVKAPSIVAATWKAAKEAGHSMKERDVRNALHQFEELWDELFPAEQQRLIFLIVERIDVHQDGANIKLRHEGILELINEITNEKQIAA